MTWSAVGVYRRFVAVEQLAPEFDELREFVEAQRGGDDLKLGARQTGIFAGRQHHERL